MNLRILKKLSKRAAPLLAALGDDRAQFAARRDANYIGIVITDRTDFERCASVHQDMMGRDGFCIAPKSRAGTNCPFVKVYQPWHPRKGTIMVGSFEGYYEPEWSEETAWEALQTLLGIHFADYSDVENPVPTRPMYSIGDVFAAAEDMRLELANREMPA